MEKRFVECPEEVPQPLEGCSVFEKVAKVTEDEGSFRRFSRKYPSHQFTSLRLDLVLHFTTRWQQTTVCVCVCVCVCDDVIEAGIPVQKTSSYNKNPML